MMPGLRRWLSRLAALALTALVLWGAGYWLPLEAWSRYKSLVTAVRDEAQTLARLNATIATLSHEPASGGVRPFDPSMFVPGASDSAAAATLQTRLNELAGASNVRLQSVGSLPIREQNGLRLIGARLQLTAGLSELHRLLYALETSRPILIVETIEWRADAALGEAAPSGQTITASLDVVGVLAASAGASP